MRWRRMLMVPFALVLLALVLSTAQAQEATATRSHHRTLELVEDADRAEGLERGEAASLEEASRRFTLTGERERLSRSEQSANVLMVLGGVSLAVGVGVLAGAFDTSHGLTWSAIGAIAVSGSLGVLGISFLIAGGLKRRDVVQRRAELHLSLGPAGVALSLVL